MEIICYENIKDFRVYFDLKTDGISIVYGKVYVNGNAVGSEHTTTNVSYVTFNDVVENVKVGDLIQVYCKVLSSPTSYVRNMRICYDRFLNNNP